MDKIPFPHIFINLARQCLLWLKQIVRKEGIFGFLGGGQCWRLSQGLSTQEGQALVKVA